MNKNYNHHRSGKLTEIRDEIVPLNSRKPLERVLYRDSNTHNSVIIRDKWWLSISFLNRKLLYKILSFFHRLTVACDLNWDLCCHLMAKWNITQINKVWSLPCSSRNIVEVSTFKVFTTTKLLNIFFLSCTVYHHVYQTEWIIYHINKWW